MCSPNCAGADCNVRELVLAAPDQPRSAVPAKFAAADVLLFTSRKGSEGSPSVIKEATVMGLPVVSVDVGDAAELLDGVEPSAVVAFPEPWGGDAARAELVGTPGRPGRAGARHRRPVQRPGAQRPPRLASGGRAGGRRLPAGAASMTVPRRLADRRRRRLRRRAHGRPLPRGRAARGRPRRPLHRPGRAGAGRGPAGHGVHARHRGGGPGHGRARRHRRDAVRRAEVGAGVGERPGPLLPGERRRPGVAAHRDEPTSAYGGSSTPVRPPCTGSRRRRW